MKRENGEDITDDRIREENVHKQSNTIDFRNVIARIITEGAASIWTLGNSLR